MKASSSLCVSGTLELNQRPLRDLLKPAQSRQEAEVCRACWSQQLGPSGPSGKWAAIREQRMDSVCTLSSSEPLDCSCRSESPGKTFVTRIPQPTPRHSDLIDLRWGSHSIFLWLPRWLLSAARVRDLCLQVSLGLCSDVKSGGGTGLDPALENGALGRDSREAESFPFAEILSLVWLQGLFCLLRTSLSSSWRNQGDIQPTPLPTTPILEGQTRKKQANPSPYNSLLFHLAQAKAGLRASPLTPDPVQLIPVIWGLPTCFSHVQLFATMDCSPPCSSVHEILQAGILEWVAMPSSRGPSWPRDGNRVAYIPALAG